MTTSVSSPAELKESVFQIIDQMVIGEELYKKLISTLEKKLTEPTPSAKDALSEETLRKIHGTYKEKIQASYINLKCQYVLGSNLVKFIKEAFDEKAQEPLYGIQLTLKTFQSGIKPLLEEQGQLDEEIAILEARIVSLMKLNAVLERV